MHERRNGQRILTLKTGKIVSPPRADIETAILDISDHGACLLVSDVNDVPDSFQLVLDRTSEAHACEVRWKTGHKVGILFQ